MKLFLLRCWLVLKELVTHPFGESVVELPYPPGKDDNDDDPRTT